VVLARKPDAKPDRKAAVTDALDVTMFDPGLFDAVLFDAGGILVLPDPTVLAPLLAYFGGEPSIDAYVRAHYAGMAAKSAAGHGETFWDAYNHAYVRSVGVPEGQVDAAATALGHTRNAHLWRWPIPDSVTALAALQSAGVPLGVVSNASGQIEETLVRSGICQAGDGPLTSMRVVIDSHIVGVAKPDPRIFDFALPHFADVARERIAYVGDSVTMDIGGARAAGLLPVLLDPHDDHAGADFHRIRTLAELLPAGAR
jgi:putative hydrolase of the HAD superfamily